MYRSILTPRTLRCLLSNIGFRTTNTSFNVMYDNDFVERLQLCVTKKCFHYDNNRSRETKRCLAVCICSLFPFFSRDDKEEETTSRIIKTLKQSKLLIQKNEFEKAEQMLHIALHQAQIIQNTEAITYIYDVMANLAFDTEDYYKAETLFITVLKRLTSNGVLENDLRVIHISLKLAKIFELKGETKKSEQGYTFCIEHLQSHLKEDPKNIEVENMLLIAFGWYAQMLTRFSRYTEAYDNCLHSYNISKKLYGDDHKQTAVVLNEIGCICYIQEKYNEAVRHFSAALEIGRKQNMDELCEFLVNLGNTYLQEGLHNKAEIFCQEAKEVAKQRHDNNGLDEANICLKKLKGLQ